MGMAWHGEFYIDSEGGALDLSTVGPATRLHGAGAREARVLRVARAAVGQGNVDEDGRVRPLDVHKRDRVLFSEYSGIEIQL